MHYICVTYILWLTTTTTTTTTIVFGHADEMIAHSKYDYYNCVFHNIHRRGNGDVFFGDFYEAMKVIGLDRDSIVRIFCRMDTEYRGCIRSFQFIGYCLGNEFVNSQLITLHGAFLNALESVEWEEKEILFDDIKCMLTCSKFSLVFVFVFVFVFYCLLSVLVSVFKNSIIGR